MHATLADVIADTAQNSIEAGARHVSLSISEDGKTITTTFKYDDLKFNLEVSVDGIQDHNAKDALSVRGASMLPSSFRVCRG